MSDNTEARIRSRNDYSTALQRIEELMHADPDTVDGAELEGLVAFVEAYEGKHFPMDE